MITFSLQSGSNGNCIYVEAGDKRILFDAGISGRQVRLRLAEHQRCISGLDAVFISHDHSDHSKNAGIYQRLFGVPVYLTVPTHQRIAPYIGKTSDIRYFEAGHPIVLDGVTIHTLPTPHDALDGVAFIVEAEGRRLGVFTDLGYPFAELAAALSTVHAAYLESNYDPEMLATGPYPPDLQDRIRGNGGHLSNQEAAELIRTHGRHLGWAALAHLSEDNNTIETAIRTHRDILGNSFPLTVASRYGVSDVLRI
ncbi:MAG: MBL fold metallo-hydrolase [Phycisphaerae bacterium]|nr:MBL fold metallo-hydrolase [Phycisphaerae bacterium]